MTAHTITFTPLQEYQGVPTSIDFTITPADEDFDILVYPGRIPAYTVSFLATGGAATITGSLTYTRKCKGSTTFDVVSLGEDGAYQGAFALPDVCAKKGATLTLTYTAP